jgi:DNA repair protein RecO (recombination protein O)
MPSHESEAIVLRHYSLSDSDRIIVFITREFGKMRAAAQGVKKPKNQMAGNLEPLSHIQLDFYSREGRDLSQLRQVELIHSYLGKNPSLAQIYAFHYFAEIAGELVQDNQPNPQLFRLLLAALNAGEANSINQRLVRYFEIWSLKLNGLLPNYAYCSNCGKCVKDEGFFAWLESGEARCHACARGRGLRIGSEAAQALEAMSKLPPEAFMNRPIVKGAAEEIENLSQRMIGLHLEKTLKSYRLLKDISLDR